MKVRVAIVSNSVTPYRVHLHQRIVQESADLELWSIFTHEYSNSPWKLAAPEQIRPLFFGAGQDSQSPGLVTNSLRDIRKALRISKELNARGIQAVILFGYNDFCLLYLLCWCSFQKIPCFIFGDSNVKDESKVGAKARIKRALLPKILRLSKGAMYCGSMGKQYFNLYGVPLEKLFPFPYEPDYQRIATVSNQQRDLMLRKLDLAFARRRLLYSGRLIDVKRVDLLIAAFQNLAPDLPGWDLIIAGDGALRNELSSLIDPINQHRVRFLGFINDPAELAGIYSCCDALILPSDIEPWGVVVTEAATRMALVCSSRVGAAYDLVEDHRNGRMFPAGDLFGLSMALREVMDPENIDRMKANSPLILAEWRGRTDPVAGLRQALRAAGFSLSLAAGIQP